jgi:hypothetical protein
VIDRARPVQIKKVSVWEFQTLTMIIYLEAVAGKNWLQRLLVWVSAPPSWLKFRTDLPTPAQIYEAGYLGTTRKIRIWVD